MNLSEIRDLVRAEAGIAGLDEYQTLIDSILNQELQAITGKAKYEEMRSSTTLTPSVDAQYIFDLPEDFQLFDSLNYYSQKNDFDPTLGINIYSGIKNGWQMYKNGRPEYYVRQGSQLFVYPFTDVFVGDTFTLEYYKRSVLILEEDPFPIPSLEKAVQQSVMARLLRLVDTKRAQMAKAEANQGFIESRAENAGNS